MTLFTANGVLVGMTQQRLKGARRAMERYLHNAYLDWHRTQRMNSATTGEVSCWIYRDPRLHKVRAPGGTCLRALSSGIFGTPEHPINSSKGCGGVMRVAPIGLYFDPAHNTPEQIDWLAARSAALTHGHPLGFISAALLVRIINQTVYGEAYGKDALYDIVTDALRAIQSEFAMYEKTAKLAELVHTAIDLSLTGQEDYQAVAKIGEGWVAEEAIAIAIYCALKYRGDFTQALIAAVNHSGDSDSTGSITGNILGAQLGYDSIPTSFIDRLEMFDLISALAEDLYIDAANDDPAHCRTDLWQRKYVRADFRM